MFPLKIIKSQSEFVSEVAEMKKQAFSFLARVGFQKIIGFLLYWIIPDFSLC